MKRIVFMAIFLAACQTEAPPVGIMPDGTALEVPIGEVENPPLMGDITGTLGANPVHWQSFDFSLGAYDASAWAGDRDGGTMFMIGGYPPGKPHDDANRLRIETRYARPFDRLAALPLGPAAAKVTVYLTEDSDGPRLEGEAALTVVTAAPPPPEGYALGHATGSVTAKLCPVAGAEGACQDIDLRFDTEVQFGG